MVTKKLCLFTLCLISFVCLSSAEVVSFGHCDDIPGSCTVHEVRVVPCPEAEENKPCKVKRGKSATIEFDYTAQWGSSAAWGQVYSVTDDGDLPLAGMDTDACEYTACPIQSSARQTYAYTLPLAKKFPVGTYTIKWVLRNPAKPENTSDRCCFTTRIKLAKWGRDTRHETSDYTYIWRRWFLFH